MTTDKPDNEHSANNAEPNSSSSEKSTPEVRYLPIDYLPELQDNPDDEIDLLELVKKIWDGRWAIIKFTAVFFSIGVFWALFSPEEYESDAILMPEVQQDGVPGGASRLLQQFGIGGGINAGAVGQGVIPPMIYPRIVNSISFQQELLQKELYFQSYDVRTTWPDFLENHYSTPLTTHVVNYTVGLPFTVLGGIRMLFTSEDVIELEDSEYRNDGFISLSREDYRLIQSLRDRISVRQDQETGLLTTSVKLQDPRAAAELNRHVIELLKEYVTEYRTDKAIQNLDFVEIQKKESRLRFEDIQMALAQFRDENVNITSARARTELERLQDERNLAFSVYSSLSQRFEEARLKVQEQTPVFTEVQGVNVPSERSELSRAILVVVFTFLGSIIAVGWVLFIPFFKTLKQNLR